MPAKIAATAPLPAWATRLAAILGDIARNEKGGHEVDSLKAATGEADERPHKRE